MFATTLGDRQVQIPGHGSKIAKAHFGVRMLHEGQKKTPLSLLELSEDGDKGGGDDEHQWETEEEDIRNSVGIRKGMSCMEKRRWVAIAPKP